MTDDSASGLQPPPRGVPAPAVDAPLAFVGHTQAARALRQDYVRGEYGSGSSSAISSGPSSHSAARTNIRENTLAMWRSMLTIGILELQEDVVLVDRERSVRRAHASSPSLEDNSNTAGMVYSGPHVPDVIAYLASRERGDTRHPARSARSTLDPAHRGQLVRWLAKFNKYLDDAVGTLQAGVHLLDAATPLLPSERPAALLVARYWLAAKQAAGGAGDAAFKRDQLLSKEGRASAALRCSGAPPGLCAASDERDMCCAALACARRSGIPPAALAAAALVGMLRLRGKLDIHLNLQLAGESGY